MRLLWANDKMRQPELTCLLPTLCQRKKSWGRNRRSLWRRNLLLTLPNKLDFRIKHLKINLWILKQFLFYHWDMKYRPYIIILVQNEAKLNGSHICFKCLNTKNTIVCIQNHMASNVLIAIKLWAFSKHPDELVIKRYHFISIIFQC